MTSIVTRTLAISKKVRHTMKARPILLMLSIMGCAAFAESSNNPTDATQSDQVAQHHANTSEQDVSELEQRVSSRWDSLIARDFAKAYTYLSPTYRKLFPLDQLLKETGTNVEWKSVDIQNISVDGDRAEVKVLLKYRLNIPPPAGFDMDEIGVIDKLITEVWIWTDGNWWYTDQNGGRLGNRPK